MENKMKKNPEFKGIIEFHCVKMIDSKIKKIVIK
jgi:hypothetical protein